MLMMPVYAKPDQVPSKEESRSPFESGFRQSGFANGLFHAQRQAQPDHGIAGLETADAKALNTDFR